MMCDRYKEAISLLACGELPAGERDSVERHLAECASCRGDYEALQRLCGRLRNLAEQDDLAQAPGGLSERLEESLRPAAHTLRWAALAAAACVLIGLAVWLISSAETNDNRARQKQEPAVSIISTPHPVAATTDLPRASWAAYYRAWLQSPETLDGMLARDAAARLKPEKNLAGLNVRSFLQTMNHIEEKSNEKHSVRGCGVDSVV
jgi:anti-sigma factor RsiW